MKTATSVTICPAKLADMPVITEIYNEAILTTTATFDIEPKSVADRTQWLQAHGEKYPVLVAVVDLQIVGYAALNRWSERSGYGQTVESCLRKANLWHSSARARVEWFHAAPLPHDSVLKKYR